MSGSTYDHLVRQVQALKKENCHLRRELEDNSSHLSKLEVETLDMKVRIFLLTHSGGLCSLAFASTEGSREQFTSALAIAQALLLLEIEKEEKEKLFYSTQIQNLARRGEQGVLLLPPQDAMLNPLRSALQVEMVFWLLSMLATRDKDDMSRTLLAMSSSQDSCVAMRKSGCLPLLIQLLHDCERDTGPDRTSRCNKEARARASAALHNIIYSQPDEGQAKREMRVLHVLEQVRSYCETCWDWLDVNQPSADPGADKFPYSALPLPIEPQICQAMCAIMKLSFDEEYRRAMNELGGLQAIAELLQVDCDMYGGTNDPLNSALRRYAGMALTNLTFGDVVNKASLCTRKSCMQSIVAQLECESEDIQQVVASILRNLSWRADINSKRILREVGSVSALMRCALKAKKESTLKSLLSALWNLSAHSTENKVAICSVEGALIFLVATLTYKCQSNSLAIIESGGGILRNVSSLIATNEEYREILRDHSCLQTLLQHLKSHSLTIVSNACGTLWNLSARNSRDQELLWDLGAVSMLRNLIHSKHKMIALGSAAALRNLLTNRPAKYKDTSMISPGSCLPSLYMRKQKALEAELDAKHLTETFDSIEKLSPKHPNLNKPLRHIESLVKDYASDSGCFDDDEGPNVSTGLETGGLTVLSMYLNSSFLQGQAMSRNRSVGRCAEAERDLEVKHSDLQKFSAVPDNVSVAAERLVNQISTTVARIDKLVEDVSNMHTSSEDSFSLSSEDQCIDWQCALDDLSEHRAKSSSPCRLSDAINANKRENTSKARTFLGARTGYANLSNDSLHCLNSTGEGEGQVNSSKESSIVDQHSELHRFQRRPTNLDLNNGENRNLDKNALRTYVVEDCGAQPSRRESQNIWNEVWGTTKLNEKLEKRLSPFHQRNSQIAAPMRNNLAPHPDNTLTPQSLSGKKQVWAYQTSLSPGILSTSGSTPGSTDQELLRSYCVEDTPICFSRCSSLSSLSSAENVQELQTGSGNDSDSSLEIIVLEDKEASQATEKMENHDAFSSKEMPIKSRNHPLIGASQPIEIPCPKFDKLFMRDKITSQLVDTTPSSPSDNYVQETPLVLSRCSSVSSLGSFENPSIASSIQSDPCSEMISGTISPSDLPDSPGQTMPPSRSKTPLFEQSEKEGSQANAQWDIDLKKHMDINDFKERFHLPPDIDTMLYFTLEKPNENFSCASSLSALTLHEPYVQKDIELKLMPLLQEKNRFNCIAHEKGEDPNEELILDGLGKADKLDCILENSDDDIEILKECINSAMPTRFRKVKTSLISGLSTQVLGSQCQKSLQLPVYMLLPTHSQLEFSEQCKPKNDDSSYSDSFEGTPVNFSSSASLSDETLEYPQKDSVNHGPIVTERRELTPAEGQNTDDLEIPIAVRMHDRSLEQGKGYKSNANEMKLNYPSSGPFAESRVLNLTQKEVLKRNQSFLSPQPSPSHKAQGRAFQPGLLANASRKEQTVLKHVELKGKRTVCKSSEELYQRPESSFGENIHGSYAFQSIPHTTPTEEAVYCFYENDSFDVMGLPTDTAKKKTETKNERDKMAGQNSGVPRKEADPNSKASARFRNPGVAGKTERNLITDETPVYFSLSSSLSSLSDVELEDGLGRTRRAFVKSKRQQGKKWLSSTAASKSFHSGCSSLATTRDSSPSSWSYDSEDDLLQKCISSAMPKKKRQSSRRKSERSAKQSLKGNTGLNVAWDLEQRNDTRRERWSSMSDLTSPDLESFEWKAIQEGANSIVTSLHQAAACLSREPSSESDSILSFVSGLSIGSTLHFTLERKDKQRSQKEQACKTEAAGTGKVGKTLNESKVTGNKSNSVDKGSIAPKQPTRAVSLPVVFRGRTVIYMPDMFKKTTTATPSVKKAPLKNNTPSKNPSQTFRSRSLHRPGKTTEKVDASLPKRSATPPARIVRGPSRGSSRNSTPSRQPQKTVTVPAQATKPVTLTGQNISKKPRSQVNSTPSTPSVKSPALGKQLRKSPVQTLTKQAAPAKKVSSFQKNEPTLHSKSQSAKRILPPNRLDLVRMSSSKSSGSEGDKSNFVRQLTFIKESSSFLMRQKSEVSSSESMSSLSQSASPRRSKSDFQTTFLRSSRYQELKVTKPASGQRANQLKNERVVEGRRNDKALRRPSSESPSRLPLKNGSLRKHEHFKRYSSSPHINVFQRAASTSSVFSVSSDSSDKTRSEEDPRSSLTIEEEKEQVQNNQPSLKGTWRRIKDEDIPYLLSNSFPPSAMPLVTETSETEQMSGKADAAETRTSDAFVQTEDFSIAKTNSSTSPTLDPVPLLTQAMTRNATNRLYLGKSTGTVYSLYSENEQELDSALPIRNNVAAVLENESHANVTGHLQFSSSRHGSPSRAARVTPFNYIPSHKTSSDTGSLRAPIFTAVNDGTGLRDV
uniref:APC regulator of WNT signaling pathway 2 n=1 Tax=Callorhinchus milii TaxID=7868 RepID=A0A4W3GSR5_CALMI